MAFNPFEPAEEEKRFNPFETTEGESNVPVAPVEKDWKYPKAFYNGLIASGGRGLLGAVKMAADTQVREAERLAAEQGAPLDLSGETKLLGDIANNFSPLQDYNVQGDTPAERFGLGVTTGLGQLTRQIGTAALTGNPGSVIGMFGDIAGNQYLELTNDGVDAETARNAAVGNYAMQAPLEYISLGKIMSKVPKGVSLPGRIAKHAERLATEGVTEGLQSFPEQLSRIYAENPDATVEEIAKKWEANKDQYLKEAAQSAVIGGVVGAVGGAGVDALHGALQQKEQRSEQKTGGFNPFDESTDATSKVEPVQDSAEDVKSAEKYLWDRLGTFDDELTNNAAYDALNNENKEQILRIAKEAGWSGATSVAEDNKNVIENGKNVIEEAEVESYITDDLDHEGEKIHYTITDNGDGKYLVTRKNVDGEVVIRANSLDAAKLWVRRGGTRPAPKTDVVPKDDHPEALTMEAPKDYIAKTDEEWAEEQAVIDAMAADLREGYSKIKNPVRRARAIKQELDKARKEYDELLAPAMTALRSGMKQGVDLVPNQDPDKWDRMVRATNNMPWYSEFYAKNRRAPYKYELEEMAEEMLSGKNSYGYADYADDGTLDSAYRFDVDRSKVNGYRSTVRTLEELYRDAKVKEEAWRKRNKGARVDYTLKQADAFDHENKKAAAELADGGIVGGAVDNWEGLTGHSRPSSDQQVSTTNASLNLSGEGIISQNTENRKVATLADGYETESGRPLAEADEREFIIKPNGSMNFGEFTRDVEDKTNGKVKAKKIRLQVGFSKIDEQDRERGFGLLHIKKREEDLKKMGYRSAENYIETIINNFNKIYAVPTTKFPDRIQLTYNSDKYNTMQMDLIAVADEDGFYTVVSAIPKKLKREANEKGTLIYDRSASLSTATNNGVARKGAVSGKDVGATAPSATNKSNVPFDTDIVTQEAEKGKAFNQTGQEKSPVPTDALTKEGEAVYRQVEEILKGGNKSTQRAAAMSALIYARRADNHAEAMRKAGREDYTALDYLKANPVHVGGKATGGSGTFNQTAWHGTPHNFRKFNLGKIGTGEGAQAHGWGLYFAKERKTARNYQTALSGGVFTYNGRELTDLYYDVERKGEWEKLTVLEDFMVRQDIEELSAEDYEPAAWKWFTKIYPKIKSAGKLLEVDVPEDDVLLDEDLPYTKQPKKVKDALKKLFADAGFSIDYIRSSYGNRNPEGAALYSEVQSIADGSAESASKLLNSYGIKGITYVGERDGRCFVVFDDKAIAVINRFNQAAGKQALTANQQALQEAQEMNEAGESKEAIYDKTGWYLGADGKWRFEIPDNLNKINLFKIPQYGETRRLVEVYDNPALYEAYPFLADVLVMGDRLKGGYEAFTDGENITLNSKDFGGERGTEYSIKLGRSNYKINFYGSYGSQFALVRNDGSIAGQAERAVVSALINLENGMSMDAVLNTHKSSIDNAEKARELYAGNQETLKRIDEIVERDTAIIEAIKKYAGKAKVVSNEDLDAKRKYYGPILIHEIQHIIQRHEGFATGGNTNAVRRQIVEQLEAYEEEAEELSLWAHSYFDHFKAWENAVVEGDVSEMSRLEKEFKDVEKNVPEKDRQQILDLLGKAKKLRDALNSPSSDFVKYQNLHGEQEARAAERKAEMNTERERLNAKEVRSLEAVRGEYLKKIDAAYHDYVDEWLENFKLWGDENVNREETAAAKTRMDEIEEGLSYVKNFPEFVKEVKENDELAFNKDWYLGDYDFRYTEEVLEGIDKYNAIILFGGKVVSGREVGTTKGQTEIKSNGQRVVKLFESADESTFVHEVAHLAYEDLKELAKMENAPAQFKRDLKTVDDWAEWKDGQLYEYSGSVTYDEFAKKDAAIRKAIKKGDVATAERLKYQWRQERFARGFEEYLKQGKAPSEGLRKVFQKFKEWITEIYKGFKAIGGMPSKEVQDVMARLLLTEKDVKLSGDEATQGAKPTEASVTDIKQAINIANEKLAEKIELRKGKKPDGFNLPEGYLRSPSWIAKKMPKFKLFYEYATEAMQKQENLRSWYGRVLNRIDDKLRKSGNYDENKKAYQELMWRGDAEGTEFSRAELEAQGYADGVISAYLATRQAVKTTYNHLNDARKQVKTYQKNMSAEELLKLKANKFVTILSEEARGDEYVVAYKSPKTWEKKMTVSQDVLADLMSRDSVQILEVRKLDGKLLKNEDALSEEAVRVKYRETAADIANRKGYVPHFFHEWFIMDKQVDEDGNTSYTVLGSARTQSEAVRKAEELLAGNEERNIVVSPKQFSLDNEETVRAAVIGDSEYQKVATRLAEELEMSVAEAKEFLQGKIRLRGRHRYFGNFRQRKGAEGFEQDLDWVLRHYFNSAARYVALEDFKPKAIGLFERYYGRFDNDYSSNPLANFTKQYINDINGNPSALETMLNNMLNSSEWYRKHVTSHFGDRAALQLANDITGKTSISKLGFWNYSSAFLNMTQLMNTVGILGSVSDVSAGLAGAVRPNMTARKIFAETGIMNDVSMDSTSGYGKFKPGALAEKSMYLFRKADMLARKATVLAAYKNGRKKGMNHKAAINYAKDVNRMANFDYSVADAPNIFRRGSVLAQLSLQFKKYPMKELELMYELATKGTSGQNAKFWGTYFLIAGLLQFPAAELFDGLWKELFGDSPKNKIKKFIFEATADSDPFAKKLADVAIYGVGAVANVDLSTRAGLGDVNPAKLPNGLGELLGGPTYSSIEQAVTGVQSLMQGDPLPVIKAISPALGNYVQAAQGYSQGRRARTNSIYETTYEQILKAAGFRSVDESKAYDVESIIKDERSERTKERTAVMDRVIGKLEKGERLNEADFSDIRRLRITKKQLNAERLKKRADRKGRLDAGLSKEEKSKYRDLLNSL